MTHPNPTGVLGEIIAAKRSELAALKSRTGDIDARLADAPPPRDFTAHLFEASRTGYGLIAEIKKASPSAGIIRGDFNPAELARAYAAGGATCLSVLTDRQYFMGDIDYIKAARDAVAAPVLRKDFIIDPLQVREARAYGSDAVLLIMAAVDDGLAKEIEIAAHDLGMAVLVEVHDRGELERVTELRSPLVGINNRNLATMKTDLATTEALVDHMPGLRLVVGESGLETPDDLARMAKSGVRVFLVGESLMRQNDVAEATRRLLADPVPIDTTPKRASL